MSQKGEFLEESFDFNNILDKYNEPLGSIQEFTMERIRLHDEIYGPLFDLPEIQVAYKLLSLFKLIECNLQYLNLNEDSINNKKTIRYYQKLWKDSIKLFNNYAPDIAEKIYSKLEFSFLTAALTRIPIKINDIETLRKVSDLYSYKWIPNLDEDYSAIICLYIASFYSNKPQRLLFLEKGAKLEEENSMFCLHYLGLYKKDKTYFKSALKRGCIPSLFHLYKDSSNPKYAMIAYKILYELVENPGGPIGGSLPGSPSYTIQKAALNELNFCISKVHEKQYKDPNKFIAEIHIRCDEYLELIDKYQKLLSNFPKETHSLIWEQNYIAELGEPIELMLEKDYDSIYITNKLMYEYYNILVRIRKLRKAITRLEDEYKYLPVIGEYYVEAEKRFNNLV
jgi:hypothetical protein